MKPGLRRSAFALLVVSLGSVAASGCGNGYGDKCTSDSDCHSDLKCLYSMADTGYGCITSDSNFCTSTCDTDADCVANGTGSQCTKCSGYSQSACTGK